jgi:N-acetylmuramoyl-L-alanine amidase
MPEHVVSQGDCLTSIATKHGFFWETVWNDPGNAELRGKRRDPHSLLPGDVVHIPNKRPKEEVRVTTRRHCFRLRGVPALLAVQFRWGTVPRAGEPFELYVDGALKKKGVADDEGVVRAPIEPNAREARIVVGTGDRRTEKTLQLGHLDPHDAVSGLKARLANIGLYAGPIDATSDENLTAALMAFQGSVGLLVTGEADEATRAALVDAHEG